MSITIHLESFEGPLDLLLHLIGKNKVSIYDIPITLILEQYLDVLSQAQDMDLDVAGDFVAMASQLVLIKSKMLLPIYDAKPEDDPRTQLVEMLLEYQRFREATPFLREQGEIGRDIFAKAPEPLPDKPIEYHHTANDLLRAAARLQSRVKTQMPPAIHAFKGIVGRELVPIGRKVSQILRKFLTHSQLSFANLFEGCQNKSEVVATFLAVLELSKSNRVYLDGTADNPTLTLVSDGATKD